MSKTEIHLADNLAALATAQRLALSEMEGAYEQLAEATVDDQSTGMRAKEAIASLRAASEEAFGAARALSIVRTFQKPRIFEVDFAVYGTERMMNEVQLELQNQHSVL